MSLPDATMDGGSKSTLRQWWEKRRALARDKRAARELRMARVEIEEYIAELASVDDNQRGGIGVVAAVIRTNMEDDGVIPPGFFDIDAIGRHDPDKTFQWKLYKAVFEFRKAGRWMDVSGTMVWLYTVQCLHEPELRPLGRALWREIARGFPHMDTALKVLALRTGKPVEERIEAICTEIPHGLEPCGEEEIPGQERP